MTNCEKFNAMLNSCQDPQAMYGALYALAPAIREARPEVKKEIKMDAAEMKKAVAETPNFFRVARELSKFKSPYKAADMLLALAGPSLKEDGQHE